MRKHLDVGSGYWSTMTQNGTRMHKLRPLKPKFFLGGGSPRPPFNNIYCLGVILQTFMPACEYHVACFSGHNPFWSPNIFYIMLITTLAESTFIKKCGVHSPMKSPNVTYFRPKKYIKWPKIGQKWPKISWPKMGFPTGRPVLCHCSCPSLVLGMTRVAGVTL